MQNRASGRPRVRDLGVVECGALACAVGRLDDDAWAEEGYRQQAFDVHRDTQSVVLLFVDLARWPRLAVARQAGWERLGATAAPVMDAIIERDFAPGGVVIRAMAARLPPGGRIAPHVDRHESLRASHRIHLPLVTNPRVRFFVDGVPHRLQAGRAVEIDNQRSHSVMNDGASHRVHFIFDYLPPERLAAPGLARTENDR